MVIIHRRCLSFEGFNINKKLLNWEYGKTFIMMFLPYIKNMVKQYYKI